MDYKADHTAFVLGMFETGLAVGRSLGVKGVKVLGIDYKRDIGFYSKYIDAGIFPNPLTEPGKFLECLLNKVKKDSLSPVLYITSDEYLEFVSKNIDILNGIFKINIPSLRVVNAVMNKNELVKLASEAGINIPESYIIKTENDIKDLPDLDYPLIIKGNNVNTWRKKVDASRKVKMVADYDSLKSELTEFVREGIEVLVQKIVPGKDDCFYKYCTYRAKDGRILAEFMLQKLHQNPINFGVGSLVKSCYITELRDQGRKLFDALHYSGTGSAEFKLDSADGKFKLIEINARYWQQNGLAAKCGINFPFTEYLYLTGQLTGNQLSEFNTGVKWINVYMDFSSFLDYRKENGMKFSDWLDDMRGEKVFSDFSSDDMLPGFYELFLSGKLSKIPKYIAKTIFG